MVDGVDIHWLHESHSAFTVPDLLTATDAEHLLGLKIQYRPSKDATQTPRQSETSVVHTQTQTHQRVSQKLLSLARHLSNESDNTAFRHSVRASHPLTFDHLEPPEITRYGTLGLYEWHVDGVPMTACQGLAINGCRAYTAIVYLQTVPEANGGATAIRFSDGSEVRVQPRRGTALFFHSYLTHRAEPLRAGQKAILNQWIRFRPMPSVLRQALKTGLRPSLHAPKGSSAAHKIAVHAIYLPAHAMLVAADHIDAHSGSGPALAMVLMVVWMAALVWRLRARWQTIASGAGSGSTLKKAD